MKKILIAVLSLGLLSACSSNNLSNNKPLYTIKGKETTSQDFYDSMRHGDDGTVVINEARSQVLATLEYDEAQINEFVNASIAQLESIFGDKMDDYLKSVGFLSREDFINKQVRPSAIIELKAKETLEKKGLELVSEYSIKNVQYLATSEKDKLEAFKLQVESGIAMSDLELDSSTKLTEGIFSKSSDIPSATLKKFMNSKQAYGLSDIIYDQESNLYFFINNLEITDPAMAVGQVIKAEGFIQNYSATLLIDAGFKVFDKDLRSNMKANYSLYLR